MFPLATSSSFSFSFRARRFHRRNSTVGKRKKLNLFLPSLLPSLPTLTPKKKKKTDRLPARPSPSRPPPQERSPGGPALPEAQAEAARRARAPLGEARREAPPVLLGGPGAPREQGGQEAEGRERQQEHQGER